MPKNLDFQCKWSLSLEIIRLKVILGKEGSIMQLLNTGNFAGSTYN